MMAPASATPEGLEKWMTRVFGSLASASFMFVTLDAHRPAGPFWYLITVLNMNAPSSAVSGCPSDHVAFGVRWNVQVNPSALVSQLVAQ